MEWRAKLPLTDWIRPDQYFAKDLEEKYRRFEQQKLENVARNMKNRARGLEHFCHFFLVGGARLSGTIYKKDLVQQK